MDPRPPNSSTEEVLFLTKDADTRTVSSEKDRLNPCTDGCTVSTVRLHTMLCDVSTAYGYAQCISAVSTVRLRTMLSAVTTVRLCTMLSAVSTVRLCTDSLSRFNGTATHRWSQPFHPYGFAQCLSAVSTVRLCTDALSSFNGVTVELTTHSRNALGRFNRTAMLRRSQPFQPYGYAPYDFAQCSQPFQPYGYTPTP